ncbi:MAG TPA: 4Fe-4S dicluster domain-containing protein [Candidatus Hydrogenedentes bacterium]|nr:4Fe-4S dicluster domain-containing protein [Candidatus Hydrogenedentota bacterium]HOC73490.1 4Fe-4S dicluster domain-containing protein [Candidatus Hydrogenedentota bacterium]HOH50916.1 4Fe-4S dicluster domain-containing protein [Candidatus Hydrogenedentota bacterium]HQL95208.1 4Fe-4S dicluster domain-containing protein [Candidatus Hydrogenedentota bacterium]HRZ83338.1 4Fe-4S dicluster domain-containing protein [Candidatus Hydrogenedentota bacterium]
MIGPLRARLKQGYRTGNYPETVPELPERYRGLPVLDPAKCAAGCGACADVCPTGAVSTASGKAVLDLGRCLFCGECAAACPPQALAFTREHRLASHGREGLTVAGTDWRQDAGRRGEELRRLFGRSFRLRQVSAGGCNACEADTNVLGTLVFDLGRFGIQFVASPRHADGILVTGPVSRNMEGALLKTYEAVPDPRVVIAVGACAVSGGVYAGHDEVAAGGVGALLPVDLWVPGCPPHPLTILDGLLRLIGRVR